MPLSVNGELTRSAPKQSYQVDEESISGFDFGYGKDWSVFKLRPNSVTQMFPGTVNGYYPVNISEPKEGTEISVSGYGMTYDEKSPLNNSLKTHSGKILRVYEYQFQNFPAVRVLNHNVDTTRGDSGAALIRIKEQDIVGIHAYGGVCSDQKGNGATLISAHPILIEAIQNCLGDEGL